MFRNIFRLIFALSLLSLSLSAPAVVVHSSGSYKNQAGRFVFTGKGERIYLLQNKADRLVIVDRYQRYDPGAQAGWASGIAPGKWSAIFIKSSPFLMSCDIKNKGGRYRKVCCKEVLNVATITRFSRKTGDDAGYWIGENLPCKKLAKEVRLRGFFFKFPACKA